jgi:hypothetical protein
VYGVSASRELMSNVTDVVADEIELWRSRPLDEVYPILDVDGIRVKIKDNGVVGTTLASLAIGVDLEGRKHALGCWIQDSEGAKFWQKVVTDLRRSRCHRDPDRLLRRADRAARCDPFRLRGHRRANMRCARDSQRHAFRVGHRPQEGRGRDAGDLHRAHARGR